MTNMEAGNKLCPRVAVFSLSSPLEVGAGNALKIVYAVSEALKRRNCEIVLSGLITSPDEAIASGKKAAGKFLDTVVFVPACWFEDYLALDFLEECDVPALLWALPGMETGSLCGSQQLASFLKYLSYKFQYVFGKAEDHSIIEQAVCFLRACALRSRLRRAKIGISGSHVNGMTHTAAFEFALKKSIGPRVIHLDLAEITAAAALKPKSTAYRVLNELKRKVDSCAITNEDGISAMKMYLALKDCVRVHNLAALTIGCYPGLMGKTCLAASLLADCGIPMACEGDVNGAAGQLILTLLSEQPTHNADWLEPLPDGSVVFTHCGSGSLSLADAGEKISLNRVRLMDQGACVLFPAKTGVVTLLSLVAGDNGYQVAMLRGEALKTSMVFPGNPVRVRFDNPFKEICDWIFAEGIGHHWMIAYGDYTKEIKAWAHIAGCLNLKTI